MPKETEEQEMRRLVGKRILEALRRDDVESAIIGHAMRWCDGAGKKNMTPDEDPVQQQLAKMARNAGGEMPPVDIEHQDAATRQKQRDRY